MLIANIVVYPSQLLRKDENSTKVHFAAWRGGAHGPLSRRCYVIKLKLMVRPKSRMYPFPLPNPDGVNLWRSPDVFLP